MEIIATLVSLFSDGDEYSAFMFLAEILSDETFRSRGHKVGIAGIYVVTCSMHAHTYSRIILKDGSGNIETWECQYHGSGLRVYVWDDDVQPRSLSQCLLFVLG